MFKRQLTEKCYRPAEFPENAGVRKTTLRKTTVVEVGLKNEEPEYINRHLLSYSAKDVWKIGDRNHVFIHIVECSDGIPDIYSYMHKYWSNTHQKVYPDFAENQSNVPENSSEKGMNNWNDSQKTFKAMYDCILGNEKLADVDKSIALPKCRENMDKICKENVELFESLKHTITVFSFDISKTPPRHVNCIEDSLKPSFIDRVFHFDKRLSRNNGETEDSL